MSLGGPYTNDLLMHSISGKMIDEEEEKKKRGRTRSTKTPSSSGSSGAGSQLLPPATAVAAVGSLTPQTVKAQPQVRVVGFHVGGTTAPATASPAVRARHLSFLRNHVNLCVHYPAPIIIIIIIFIWPGHTTCGHPFSRRGKQRQRYQAHQEERGWVALAHFLPRA